MANYWETGMAQKYKARTQQGKFKRDSEKRDKFAGWGSKIGGLLFGAPGNYLGGEIGGMFSGVSRDDIKGDDDDWFLGTRKATLEGIDQIGTDAAWESIKSGNFFGAVGGMLGGGKFKLPGGLQLPGYEKGGDTFGDLSSFLGGDSSGGTGGSFLDRFKGGGSTPDMPPEYTGGFGGGEDSALNRVMGNVNQQIPEGWNTNTFLVHKQMFPEQTPEEVAKSKMMSLEEYMQALIGLGE